MDRGRLLALAALLLAPACTREDSPTPPQGPLTLALAADLGSFDPLRADYTYAQVLQRQVYETLFEYDYLARPWQVRGLLAESWEEEADGRTWRIRLRPDARFHDPGPEPLWPGGTRPVTARDVVLSWLRQADASQPAAGWFVFEGLLAGLDEFHAATRDPERREEAWRRARAEGLPGLRAEDEQTLLLRLTGPAPDLLLRLASPYTVVVPWEAAARTSPPLAEHPVGSGPYVLAELLPRERALFRRTPGWRGQDDPLGPGKLPHLEALRFLRMEDPDTRTLLFERGETAILAPTQDAFARLVRDGRPAPALADRGVRLLTVDTPDLTMLVFAMDDPVLGAIPGDPTADEGHRLLRNALALAFPRERWRRIVRKGDWAVPARGFLPPGLPASSGAPPCPSAREDLEEARRLLAAAGHPEGAGLPELVLELEGSSGIHRDMGLVLQEAWARIGIRLRVVPNTYGAFQEKVARRQAQLFFYSWSLDWPDSLNLLALFHGGQLGALNLAAFQDPDFDRIYGEARALAPSPERSRRIHALLEILGRRLPAVPVDHRRGFLLVQPWLAGVRLNPFDVYPCKYWRLAAAGAAD